jgi:hypothetical protein
MNLKFKAILGSSLAAVAGTTMAGEMTTSEVTPPVMIDESSEIGSAVSGSLSFDYNSHFISYGADVWGAGDELNDALFNPSIALTWATSESTSLTLGAWADVNDNLDAEIGKHVQEVDVWVGYSFPVGPVAASVTYQAWMYAGDIEHIVDLGLSIDAPFAPSFTVHGRVDDFPNDSGAVFVLGADLLAYGEGVSLGELSLSAPIAVAAATDGFHGGDSGYAYSSVGLKGTLPLSFIAPAFGEWDLHGGLTYFITEEDVIPNNPDDSFLTASFGIGTSF